MFLAHICTANRLITLKVIFNRLSNSIRLYHCRVDVVFVKANGMRIKAIGKVGDSLLDVVVNNSIDLEGFGACEGTLTCSTCHLILNQHDYDRLPGALRILYILFLNTQGQFDTIINITIAIDFKQKTRTTRKSNRSSAKRIIFSEIF